MRSSSSFAVVMLLLAGVAYADPAANPDCFGIAKSDLAQRATAAPPGNTEIRVKTSAIIGATAVNDTLYVGGGPVKLPFEYINRDSNSYYGQNYFVVYSPDGATWEHGYANGGNYRALPVSMRGIWIDTTGFYPKSDFGTLYAFSLYGADGSGRDTLRFVGIANDPISEAFRPLDSGVQFYAIIRPKLSDAGKHICIDSVNPDCGCTWKWPSLNYYPSFTNFPAWNGPYCFTIANCCRGVTGNYDCDPEDRVDISDVSAFVDRYITLAMPCCAGEANTDGSADGNSDISDLSALIDYLFIRFTPLPPCR